MSKTLMRSLKLLFALGFLLSVVFAAVRIWKTEETKALQSELIAIHQETVGDSFEIEPNGKVKVLNELPPDPLRERNPDYLGWLTVYGTPADLPVVLGEDNSYYLSHNFDREYDWTGCLFADAETDREADGNLLIFGHKRIDGTMFGSLDRFANKDFFAENEVVMWQRDGKAWLYRVFAVLVISGNSWDKESFPFYEYINEISPEKTQDLIYVLRNRARLWRDIEFEKDDKFLFLVTCEYTLTNGRLLVCAKRI